LGCNHEVSTVNFHIRCNQPIETDLRLIAHASLRYSTLDDVAEHPFFKNVKWDDLRSTRAPFVPALDSEIDTGYYDDFTSPEDMAKYAEVKEKQKNVDLVKETDEPMGRGVWVGFTFGKNGLGPKAGAVSAYSEEDDGTLATIF
jgi:hypothetical protein